MSTKCMITHCDARSRLQKYWRVLRQLVQNQVLKKNNRIQFISISQLSDNLFKENKPSWQNKSRRIDLMLEVRKKKLLRVSDLEKIFLMFKPNAKTTASGIRSLKNTWEALSGEKVLKARDNLEEYIEPADNIIKDIEWY